jgi:hypothetical protein
VLCELPLASAFFFFFIPPLIEIGCPCRCFTKFRLTVVCCLTHHETRKLLVGCDRCLWSSSSKLLLLFYWHHQWHTTLKIGCPECFTYKKKREIYMWDTEKFMVDLC